MIKNKTEILAPAGSMEAFTAAVRCGADAVYLGAKNFSARANATNFDKDELHQAVKYAHRCGVKVYQTVNTLIFDDQINELSDCIKTACETGIDALIVQDMGVARFVRETAPDMPLHASTQMTIHTPEGARLAKEHGFTRVVVSREMSEEQLREIAKTGIEIEAFVHGALCMSVSGQCYMSAMIGSRSANRGLCAQACRLPFSAIDGEKRCDLSLKDMSYVDYLCHLKDIGIVSFKIEGRMKRPEYVAAAVSACRSALDKSEYDSNTLRAVFSRSGFTDGYYTGNTGKEMFGIRQKDDVVSAEDVLPSLRELYRKERKATSVCFDITIEKDKPSTLTAKDSEGNSVTVTGEIPMIANNRPTDIEQVKRQLSKLGDTIYSFDKVTGNIGEGLILPASQLNELRRKAVEELDAMREKENTPLIKFTEKQYNFFKTLNIKHNTMRIEIESADQIEGLDTEDIEYIIAPLDEWKKLVYIKDKVILSLPRYMAEEEYVEEELDNAVIEGFSHILCTNYAYMMTGKKRNLKMHGGFGLNITNSLSLMEYKDYGLCDATASFEMKLNQISTLSDELPYGIIAYGKLPLMLTVNCPIKSAVGCKNCHKELVDRTGRHFPVLCHDDAVEILNCDTLYLADRQKEIEGTSFITLKFYDETNIKVKEVINKYRHSSPAPSSEFTRGLYYRGII